MLRYIHAELGDRFTTIGTLRAAYKRRKILIEISFTTSEFEIFNTLET